MEESLEDLVRKAVSGNKKALESLVLGVQDMVYNLAVRMLWHPDDAQDATQEILIKIITNLSSFQHRSAFTTWVYRLASNNLINFKNKRFKQKLSFENYAQQLKQGFSDSVNYTPNKAEQHLLVQEAKVGCSNAMLQCLTKESRLVYIIGEILAFNSKEGGLILGISPENFRKRLSRARAGLHQFLNGNCGLVNPNNSCRCYKKVDSAIANGFIQPNKLLFAATDGDVLVEAIEAVENEVSLYQTNPNYNAPHILMKEVQAILNRTEGL